MMITSMPRIAIATEDFDSILTAFGDAVGMPLVDISSESVESLGAKLGFCVPATGSNIELMSPADPAAPLSRSLHRFLDRRGSGLFAMMLEAANPNEEADRLQALGLNVLPLMAGAGGRDIHPNSTHGVLIRIYPTGSFDRSAPEPTSSLGLSGVTSVMVAVDDMVHAREIYGDKLGLEVVFSDECRGLARTVLQPPTGGRVMLVSPVETSDPLAVSVAEHLRTRGEGMYALVLQSVDAAATGAALAERGLEVQEWGSPLVELFGVRMLIEDVGGSSDMQKNNIASMLKL